mgnify:CR=1 FL=1
MYNSSSLGAAAAAVAVAVAVVAAAAPAHASQPMSGWSREFHPPLASWVRHPSSSLAACFLCMAHAALPPPDPLHLVPFFFPAGERKRLSLAIERSPRALARVGVVLVV